MITKFTVFCWNVGDRLFSTRVSERKIINNIIKQDADIVCVQELVRKNIIQSMQKRYHGIALCNDEQWNDNAVLSKSEILDHGELTVGAHLDGRQFEMAVWVTVKIENYQVRIYNCHLEIKHVGICERIESINKVFAHAAKTTLPTIICGDMNTTIPDAGIKRWVTQIIHKEPTSKMVFGGQKWKKDERHAFAENAKTHGFHDALDINMPTWAVPRTHWECYNLKMDWFLVRGISAEVKNIGSYITDHRPLLIECKIPDKNATEVKSYG